VLHHSLVALVAGGAGAVAVVEGQRSVEVAVRGESLISSAVVRGRLVESSVIRGSLAVLTVSSFAPSACGTISKSSSSISALAFLDGLCLDSEYRAYKRKREGNSEQIGFTINLTLQLVVHPA
jgi:hypothetical protein